MENPFEKISNRLDSIESLLLEIRQDPTNHKGISDEDKFLTVPEAAAFLRISVPTVYTMIHQKRVPFIKVSKRVYFLQKDLVTYLKNHRARIESNDQE